MCTDRRQFLVGGASLGITTILSAQGAYSQFYEVYCSWSGSSSIGQGLAPASPTANREVGDIAAAIGFRAPIQVFRGGVQNASATTISGYPTVIYNPDFLGRLARCRRAAALSVLAHEVGHLANADVSWQAQYRHPWTRELGADWVSGLALGRLGISLDSSLSGIRCSFGEFSPGSASHPDSQRRLRAVAEGWHSA